MLRRPHMEKTAKKQKTKTLVSPELSPLPAVEWGLIRCLWLVLCINSLQVAHKQPKILDLTPCARLYRCHLSHLSFHCSHLPTCPPPSPNPLRRPLPNWLALALEAQRVWVWTGGGEVGEGEGGVGEVCATRP